MKNLGSYLTEIYEQYKHKHSSKDPVWILHKFNDACDIEIAGLIVSCYSYGRVEQINSLMNKLFRKIGFNVHEFTVNFSEQKDKKLFKGLDYRFNSSDDMINLFKNIQHNLKEHGSLKNLFLKGIKEEDLNVLNGLQLLGDNLRSIKGRSKSYSYLIPDARKNSACKRLNLYLRWMVREDEIDTGCWKEAGKEKLLFPVDTHVYRVSRKLGLIDRKSCDMRFVIELTESLKQFDADDPVKFDFALCHIGMEGKS